MAKFHCFVTQTIRNNFIIEADDEDAAHNAAIERFNSEKNLDIDTECVVRGPSQPVES
jgi:hypothetical protein